MTAAQKAIELIDKFKPHVIFTLSDGTISDYIRNKCAKEAALIAVELVIKDYESLNENTGWDWDAYLTAWDEVKEEILKQQ